MPTRIRDLLRQLEQDGWYLVRQKVAIASISMQRNPERSPFRDTKRRVSSEDAEVHLEAGRAGTMTRGYLVIYEHGEENYSGFAPDVPGCASTGKTLQDMRENLREALEFHLEGLALDGQQIPVAATHLVEVPENGFAEWLTVTLPALEAVSA